MIYIALDDDAADRLAQDLGAYLQDKPIQGFEEMSETLWDIQAVIEQGGSVLPETQSWKGPAVLVTSLILFWWLWWYLVTR